MKRRIGWIAGLAAGAILLATTATAFGYQGQVAGVGSVKTDPVVCGSPFTVTATFVDTAGAPLTGESVVWSFVSSPSAADTINLTPTVTNANGVATTTLTLGLVNGTREVRATVGTVSATVVVNAACGGVLPNTSTLPTETTPGQTTPLLVMLLALVFTIGGALTLRRLASTRR
jgi:hypothetical protein